MERFVKLVEDMNAHAMQDYPRECVGIVTNDFNYIRCTNTSPYPKTTFILDPADLVRNDGNIWGIFHSHPGEDNPIPSREDKVSAAFQEYKFLVGFFRERLLKDLLFCHSISKFFVEIFYSF